MGRNAAVSLLTAIYLILIATTPISFAAGSSKEPAKKSDPAVGSLGLVIKSTHKQKARSIKLTDVVRQTLAFHFDESPDKGTLKEFAKRLEMDGSIPNQFKKPAGVFVTLSREGKTRACWGSVSAQHPDLVQATIYATEGALNKEYRYASINKHELAFLKPQVTVVRALEPVESFRQINPVLCGLMVRSGGKAAVLLPGEAVDPYYQMIQCKLKAGIDPKSSCQMYRMKCNVFQ